MTVLFFILILLITIGLAFLILVQNPKGGGLSGNIAGIGNQFMGVKQTTDVLEKGTWIFASAIALLCLFSSFFMTISTSNDDDILNKINPNAGTSAPAQQQQPAAPLPAPQTAPQP